MAFESFADFIDMGGHGLFVWLSYALGIFTIVGCIVQPLLQSKAIKRDLRRRFRREEGSA